MAIKRMEHRFTDHDIKMGIVDSDVPSATIVCLTINTDSDNIVIYFERDDLVAMLNALDDSKI